MPKCNINCPECKSENTRCYVEIVDGAEHLDKYTLLCRDCGHTESETKKAGSLLYGDHSGSICPYCGKSHKEE